MLVYRDVTTHGVRLALAFFVPLARIVIGHARWMRSAAAWPLKPLLLLPPSARM